MTIKNIRTDINERFVGTAPLYIKGVLNMRLL